MRYTLIAIVLLYFQGFTQAVDSITVVETGTPKSIDVVSTIDSVPSAESPAITSPSNGDTVIMKGVSDTTITVKEQNCTIHLIQQPAQKETSHKIKLKWGANKRKRRLRNILLDPLKKLTKKADSSITAVTKDPKSLPSIRFQYNVLTFINDTKGNDMHFEFSMLKKRNLFGLGYLHYYKKETVNKGEYNSYDKSERIKGLYAYYSYMVLHTEYVNLGIGLTGGSYSKVVRDKAEEADNYDAYYGSSSSSGSNLEKITTNTFGGPEIRFEAGIKQIKFGTSVNLTLGDAGGAEAFRVIYAGGFILSI